MGLLDTRPRWLAFFNSAQTGDKGRNGPYHFHQRLWGTVEGIFPEEGDFRVALDQEIPWYFPPFFPSLIYLPLSLPSQKRRSIILLFLLFYFPIFCCFYCSVLLFGSSIVLLFYFLSIFYFHSLLFVGHFGVPTGQNKGSSYLSFTGVWRAAVTGETTNSLRVHLSLSGSCQTPPKHHAADWTGEWGVPDSARGEDAQEAPIRS